MFQFVKFKQIQIHYSVKMFNNIETSISKLLEKPFYLVAHQLLGKRFQQSKVDQTHGLKHAQKVVDNTVKALSAWKFLHQGQQTTQLNDQYRKMFQDILLASLLHDADDRKYFPTNKNLDNARMILDKAFEDQQGQRSKRKQRIIEIINLVSFSKNGDIIDHEKPLLYYYTRYADRIQAIGIKGLIRCYEYNKHCKRPLFDQKTCRPKNSQELQNCIKGRQQQYIKRGGTSNSFIDHIYDKLLHIKLPEPLKQQNAFFACKYATARQQLADFVLKNAAYNFEKVSQEMENMSELSEF